MATEPQPVNWQFDVNSIIEGVAIGIVVTILLSGYDIHRRWRRRKREQLSFIRELLTISCRNINNATDLGTVSINSVRLAIFESLLRDFRTISELRTSELYYANVFDLQKILRDVESFMLTCNIGNQRNMNQPDGMNFYDVQFFDKLRNLCWLKWTR